MRAKADPTAPAGERPHTSPSANGPDGSPSRHDTPDAANGDGGRDARGRFAKGNRGGPGNPFARQVAALRQALLDVVTEEDMEAIAVELVRQAREGNLAAMKLLFSYTLGRPAEAVNPDTLDLEEWQLYRQGAAAGPELPGLVRSMPVELACDVQRAARPGMGEVYRKELLDGLQAMEQQDAEAGRQDEQAEGEEVEPVPAAGGARNDNSENVPVGEPRGSGVGSDAGTGVGLPRGLTEAEWLAGLGLPLPDGEQAPSANGGNGRGAGGAPSANGARNDQSGPAPGGEGGAKR